MSYAVSNPFFPDSEFLKLLHRKKERKERRKGILPADVWLLAYAQNHGNVSIAAAFNITETQFSVWMDTLTRLRTTIVSALFVF